MAFSCGGGEDIVHVPDPVVDQNVVGHRPIPADNPVWDELREGFALAPEFYGERRWDDVRMRVFSHLASASRDRARQVASTGDFEGAATLYVALAERLDQLELGEEGSSRAIRDLLANAARRDARLCSLLSAGELNPAGEEIPGQQQGEGGLASIRRALLFTGGDADRVQAVQQALQDLSSNPPWQGIDIETFRDFEARHLLREQLYRFALDATDPLTMDYTWGYWLPAEASRQLGILDQAADLGEVTPAALAARIATERRSGPPERFTVDGLGGLPTGDSYIDVGGEPGPMAIGRLERLDREDPEYRAWLEPWVTRLNAGMEDAGGVLPVLVELVAAYDAMGHGSRYYNIKQARNESTRLLARAGRYDEALAVHRTHWPLHAQDFECPNREGILQGLEARLMLLAGDEGAQASLDKALESAETWLARIQDGSQPRPPKDR